MPFAYILRCGDGSLYTGAAKDLAARLRQHQAGRASRYTRARLPVKLEWSRTLRTWSQALREECRIKRLRRTEKEALIALSRAAGSEARVERVRPSGGNRGGRKPGSRGPASRGRVWTPPGRV